MPTLCILGASGFIGGRALWRARSSGAGNVRVLAHRRPMPDAAPAELIRGDATDIDCLERLLEPGAVALNFAYVADGTGERIADALSAACARRGVLRLVHISTCSVYGTTPGAVITEDSPCEPSTPYERSKHAIEDLLRSGAAGRYELVVLRPTAVFGAGGRNLESVALRVLRQSWPRRYLRACAMGRRRMHAIDVDCVAAAALFLASTPMRAPVEDFIVSQDDESMNDYQSLEAFFVRRFAAASYPLRPLSVPPRLFSIALRLASRSVTDPHRTYSAVKLAGRGFRPPRSFTEGLEEYATWVGKAHARP
jgi:nucleoside-diphosphate-sugar epimerase